MDIKLNFRRSLWPMGGLLVVQSLLMLIDADQLPLPLAILRVVLGFIFLFLIPGYTLQAALFPRNEEISDIERIALSFGLSVAIIPPMALILDTVERGLRLEYIVLAELLFIFIVAAIAIFQTRNLSEEERFSIHFTFRPGQFWQTQTRTQHVLLIFYVLVLLIAFSSILLIVFLPSPEDRYTEFYILGAGNLAEDYPRNVTLGEPVEVMVGIYNHEQETLRYTIEVRNEDAIIGGLEDIPIAHQERLEIPISFSPIEFDNDVLIEFYLYRDDQQTPYRTLRLWTNTVQPTETPNILNDPDQNTPIPTATVQPASSTPSATDEPTETPAIIASSPESMASTEVAAAASATPTQTLTETSAPTLTPTATVSATLEPTATHTQTASPTATLTHTPTFTDTSTSTPSPTSEATNTVALDTAANSINTSTATNTATTEPSATFTATLTETPTETATPTATASATLEPTATHTQTPSPTVTLTHTPTFTDTPTSTPSPTVTSTPTLTPTVTSTFTPSVTNTPTATYTASNTPTASWTPTLVPPSTPVETFTPTPPPQVSSSDELFALIDEVIATYGITFAVQDEWLPTSAGDLIDVYGHVTIIDAAFEQSARNMHYFTRTGDTRSPEALFRGTFGGLNITIDRTFEDIGPTGVRTLVRETEGQPLYIIQVNNAGLTDAFPIQRELAYILNEALNDLPLVQFIEFTGGTINQDNSYTPGLDYLGNETLFPYAFTALGDYKDTVARMLAGDLSLTTGGERYRFVLDNLGGWLAILPSQP